MNEKLRKHLCVLLFAVASLQIVGYVVGSQALRGLAAATAAAPLPLVFSDVRGLEPFASKFTFILDDADSIPITPELYQRLQGPYNRRNVYGAALAYAPRFPAPLWEAVYCHGFRPGGVGRKEFGISDDVSVKITIETRTAGRTDSWLLSPACAQ